MQVPDFGTNSFRKSCISCLILNVDTLKMEMEIHIVLLYHMISMFYIIFTGNKITQYYGYKLFSIDNQYGPEITY